MNVLDLFTGAGGGALAFNLLGYKHVGYVEINEYCQQVIRARIDDGIFNKAPIFTDVREFVQSGAAEQYKGIADLVAGGFPCQPFSIAGERKGNDDERDMWPATRDIIRLVRPERVFLENVPNILVFRYFGRILRDLAEMGYFVRWGCVSGRSCGTLHTRERVWIYATNNIEGRVQGRKQKEIYRFGGLPWGEDVRGVDDLRGRPAIPEPIIRRINDAVPRGADRIRACGNAQIPRVAATAYRILSGC